MSYPALQDDLPEVYRHIFPDLFKLPIPTESFATCADCKMVCKDEDRKKAPGTRSFLPDAKCCTYYPCLPNYLVGAILSDTDPSMEEGKRRIRENIAKRTSVTPVGVFAPRLYNLIYNHGTTRGFGNSSNFLCPYFHKGNGTCTIWKYREAVCSTFFCKTFAGPAGVEFWDVVRRYLFQAQDSLMKYTIIKLNIPNFSSLFSDPVIGKADTLNLSVEEIDGKPTSDEDYNKIWGEWKNKEENFFIQSYNLIKKLTPGDFRNIAGINQILLAQELEKSRNKVVNIPSILKKNEHIIFKKSENGNYQINLATIDISFELAPEAIDYFDGERDNAKVLKELNEKEDIELDAELLVALYHHKILLSNQQEPNGIM